MKALGPDLICSLDQTVCIMRLMIINHLCFSLSNVICFFLVTFYGILIKCQDYHVPFLQSHWPTWVLNTAVLSFPPVLLQSVFYFVFLFLSHTFLLGS